MRSFVFVILCSVLFCVNNTLAQRTTGSFRHDELIPRPTERHQHVVQQPAPTEVPHPVSVRPRPNSDPPSTVLVTINYPVLLSPPLEGSASENGGSVANTDLQGVTLNPDVDGYDFSEAAIVPYDDGDADMYFERSDNGYFMNVDDDTDIWDVANNESLEKSDPMSSSGWSQTKSVPLAVGHLYVVRTWDHDFVEIKASMLSGNRFVFDWTYLEPHSKLVAGYLAGEHSGSSGSMFDR